MGAGGGELKGGVGAEQLRALDERGHGGRAGGQGELAGGGGEKGDGEDCAERDVVGDQQERGEAGAQDDGDEQHFAFVESVEQHARAEAEDDGGGGEGDDQGDGGEAGAAQFDDADHEHELDGAVDDQLEAGGGPERGEVSVAEELAQSGRGAAHGGGGGVGVSRHALRRFALGVGGLRRAGGRLRRRFRARRRRR